MLHAWMGTLLLLKQGPEAGVVFVEFVQCLARAVCVIVEDRYSHFRSLHGLGEGWAVYD